MDSTDIEQPKPAPPKRLLSRRAFIGLSAAVGAIALAKIPGAVKEEDIFLAGVNDEIPPLLQGVEIPKSNEFYRPVQQIVQEGFDTYRKWREQNPNLPQLYWKKPDNYLDYASLVKFIAKETATSFEDKPSRGRPLDYKTNLYFAIDRSGAPNSNYIRFAWDTISEPRELVDYDPGTGIMRRVNNKFKALKNDPNYDLYSQMHDTGTFLYEDTPLLAQGVREELETAVDYVKKQGKGKPISTSVLLAYFLHQNKGNIAESFWDTTLTLKLLSRNNLDNMRPKPTRQASDLLASLFQDEFSPGVSFNFVNDNVPSSDERLNDPKEDQFKNYQPINRAGGLYHAWDIIALTTCMPPGLAQNITRSYSGMVLDYRNKHGIEKVRADIRVAAAAGDIVKLIAPYEQKGVKP